MPARSKARKRALDVLSEADPPVSPYAVELVRGVQAHRDRIDELLSTYAEDWTLARMAAVDRNTLRIGAYELLWADDVPDGVAISEAVALARDLSSDASPAFVNGLLAKLLAVKPTLTEALADDTIELPDQPRSGEPQLTREQASD